MNPIKELTGYLHSVETFGALDGPGIRYVAFMQGCPLRCAYCHNPDSWDISDQACTAGKPVTVTELYDNIMKYHSFIKNGGVTFSGGEPLLQAEFIAEVIVRLKRAGLHTAIDTAGAAPLEKCREAVDLADLLLLDIKALDDGLCRHLTGSGNKGALTLLDYCETSHKKVWIRHVLVPGLTLVSWRLARLADFLKKYTCIEKFEPLGYHKLGEYKWQELGLAYTLADTPPVDKQEVERVREMFRSKGIPT